MTFGADDRREQRLVQALVAEAGVEAFDEAVLHRLVRRDVMSLDTSGVAPFEHSHAGHLRAIVRDDRLRSSALLDDGIELTCHPQARY